MAKPKILYRTSADGSVKYYSDGNFIYAVKDGKEVRLDLFDTHYYKLRLWNGVPILEIDGLRMQPVRDFKTPLHYAKAVVKALGIPDNGQAVVLDTCMGLGYTAIEASKKKGIAKVITCEKSDAVIALAQWNPLSGALFEKNGKITIVHGSIAELIKSLEPEAFDFIIHDPPRFSHAPELYSSDFYMQLYRVCKRRARIFHYVGAVGSKSGRRIEKGTMERLSAAGFRKIRHIEKLQGILADK